MSRRVLISIQCLVLGFVLAGVAAAVTGVRQARSTEAQAEASQVQVDSDDIGGVVTGTKGAESGVWVIAETSDFPTKLRKIVVTDDHGRFLLPDLPKANYRIWVRGYGLVDSQPVESALGKTLALTAVEAPDAKAAAQYYPANYWYSLLHVPPKQAFPMKVDVPAPVGGGPAVGSMTIATQEQWISQLKGCVICHQMGDKATREIPPGLGKYTSTFEAWEQVLRIGGNAGGANLVNQMGHEQMVGFYADWTDRIAAGEVPEAPPRPSGIEKNLVLTVWDAGAPTTFMHDVISTDKRNPTLNSNGRIYGIDYHNGTLVIMDPVKNTNETIPLPTIDNKKNMRANEVGRVEPANPAPSPYWTPKEFNPIDDPSNPNSLTMDELGRVWMSSGVRAPQTQAVCRKGSSNKFAQAFPIDYTDRHLSVYDPRTKTFKLIPTCFRTHHVNFGYDKDRTVYADGGSPSGVNGVVGWVNTRMYDETGDAMASQGWCAPYIDLNENGRFDPEVDLRVTGNPYSVQPSPLDGSVWVAYASYPGKILRMTRGDNPPATCKFEVYEPPFDNPARPGVRAFFPRGIDVDSNGVVWTALAGSSQFASFDRTKCRVISGPTATGQHCPEGWTLYPIPGPNFKGVDIQTSTEWAYYNWVDKYNTFGMGDNIPIANGTNSDSLMVLNPKTGKWTMLRVPYPISFYQRGLDGRIDDPNAGWKGRGLWAGNGTRTPWHQETGKGQVSTIVRFQLRPDPLAK
jgi:hypothetical protein